MEDRKNFNFVMVYRDGARILREKGFHGMAFRVFLYLLEHVRYGNRVTVDVGEMVKGLRMSRQGIYDNLLRLEDNNIVRFAGKPSKGERSYMLNPSIMRRGRRGQLWEQYQELGGVREDAAGNTADEAGDEAHDGRGQEERDNHAAYA